jgi:F-type H+-transporting ATPase subunit a
MINRIFSIVIFFSLLFFSFNTFGAEGGDHDNGDFNAGEMIMHHIADSYEWFFPLPVILYSNEYGLDIFWNTQFNHDGIYKNYVLDHGKIHAVDENVELLNLSISKIAAQVILSSILMIIVFTSMAGFYKKKSNRPPKGLAAFLEPVVIFITEEVAKPNIGPRYKKYLPFLLTLFFFILINNFLGLMPGSANVTGNLAITGVLAIFTFLITQFSANKNYWLHIFNTPGVPWWLKFPIPIMPAVELIGVFTKPLSLMIRLFANITAGHIVILSFFSLIFIFSSYWVGIPSLLLVLFMTSVEILVAVIQAFIFTLLSSIYFGSAVEEHHEHEDEIEKAVDKSVI